MVAGSTGFVDYLKYSCPGLIYSTALVPASVAGTKCVLDILESEFSSISSHLRNNHTLLTAALKEHGYSILGGEAPIISITCGKKDRTVDLAKRFFEKGIITTPFIEPSVPPRKGVVRIIPQAGLTKEDRSKVIGAIRSIDGWLTKEK